MTADNDPPTFDAIADQTVNEDSGSTVVVITGISVGPVNEATQTFTTFSAASATTATETTAAHWGMSERVNCRSARNTPPGAR